MDVEREPYQHSIPGLISAKKFMSLDRANKRNDNRWKRMLDSMVLLKQMTFEEGIDYIRKQPWRKLNGFIVENTQKKANVRVHMFASGQTKCVKCGLQGSYFRIERHKNDSVMPFSVNLYAIDKDGHHVMMTWDHVLPRSREGANTIENAQCMCRRCNEKKGNRMSLQDMLDVATHPNPAAIWYSNSQIKLPHLSKLIQAAQAEYANLGNRS